PGPPSRLHLPPLLLSRLLALGLIAANQLGECLQNSVPQIRGHCRLAIALFLHRRRDQGPAALPASAQLLGGGTENHLEAVPLPEPHVGQLLVQYVYPAR